MESLSELNQRVQKPRYKEVGNWMVRKILRPASVPITWVIVQTPISADQVTLFALFLGLLGNFFIAQPTSGSFLIGTICLQLWYLFDHVDGQVARYRKTSCLTGRFFDFLMHHLIHGTVSFALGWHVFLRSGDSRFILIGFVGALSVLFFNMIYDIQYKTFFEKILTAKHINVKSAAEFSEAGNAGEAASGSVFKTVFQLAHKCLEMHVMMNVLTAAACIRIFTSESFKPRLILCVFYSTLAVFVCVSKYYVWINSRKIDSEFNKNFSPID